MEVTESLVHKLAMLARLEFSPDETGRIREDLQQIISFVAKLEELDLTGVKPLRQVSPARNRLRDDEEGPPLPVEEVMKNAPIQHQDYFVVPKMVRKEK